jgi:putative ABC transport system permease protein
VSNRYFELLGIPLRSGRAFTPRDAANAPPVAIVSEAFARHYLPGEDPIGKRIGFGDRKNPNYWRTIVAVAGDTRQQPARRPRPTAYVPVQQDREPWNMASYMVRTTLPATAAGELIRRAVMAVDPDQPISRLRTLDEALARSVSMQRFTTLLSSAFASLALLLAAVGTFGVMSHVVGTRTREIGVRLALGAEGRDIVRLIVGQTLGLVAVAAGAGLAGAALVAGSIRPLLFEVSARDPATFATAAAVMAVSALVASYVPVRRALAQNPLVSLRSE